MSLDLPKGFEAVLADEARGQIKLNDFSTIFFPMFIAYFKGEENVELGRWLTFTKTKGYEWVDVMQGGEVIFSVPPMLQSITLEPGKSLAQDPSEIMHIATIKDRTIPGAVNAHIRSKLTDALDLSEDYANGQDEYRKNWLPIFNYYGYTLEGGASKSGAGSNVSDEYNPGDFTDYDEL